MTDRTSHWLMNSEPDVYGFDDLIAQGEGTWDGVRSHAAAGHLKAMRVGDHAFFYHSNIGKEAVGVMEVTAEALPDPTAPKGTPWVAVKVRALQRLATPVPLATIKTDAALAGMVMVRQSRLSVAPMTKAEWDRIVELGGGTVPL